MMRMAAMRFRERVPLARGQEEDPWNGPQEDASPADARLQRRHGAHRTTSSLDSDRSPKAHFPFLVPTVLQSREEREFWDGVKRLLKDDDWTEKADAEGSALDPYREDAGQPARPPSPAWRTTVAGLLSPGSGGRAGLLDGSEDGEDGEDGGGGGGVVSPLQNLSLFARGRYATMTEDRYAPAAQESPGSAASGGVAPFGSAAFEAFPAGSADPGGAGPPSPALSDVPLGDGAAKDEAASALGALRTMEQRRVLQARKAARKGTLADSSRRLCASLSQEIEELWSRGVLHPESRARAYLEGLTFAFALYSVVVAGLRLAFRGSPGEGALGAFLDATADVLFVLRMLSTLRTAFDDGRGHLVVDPRDIALRYLRRGFLVDLAACASLDRLLGVPWLLVLKYLRFGYLRHCAKRLLAVPSSAELVAVLHWKGSSGSWLTWLKGDLSWQLIYTMSAALSVCLQLCLLLHMASCLWFYAFCRTDDARLATWQLCGAAGDRGSQYLSALYFMMVTTLSVGFGDIAPRSSGEQLFAVVLEVAGAALFGVIIAQVRGLAARVLPIWYQSHRRLSAVGAFCRERDLSLDLSARVLAHFHHALSKTSLFPSSAASGPMPPPQRDALRQERHRPLAQEVGLRRLMRLSPDAQLEARICEALLPSLAAAGDLLLQPAGAVGRAAFVASGRLDLYVLERPSPSPAALRNDDYPFEARVAPPGLLDLRRRAPEERGAVFALAGLWGKGRSFNLPEAAGGRPCPGALLCGSEAAQVYWLEAARLEALLAEERHGGARRALEAALSSMDATLQEVLRSDLQVIGRAIRAKERVFVDGHVHSAAHILPRLHSYRRGDLDRTTPGYYARLPEAPAAPPQRAVGGLLAWDAAHGPGAGLEPAPPAPGEPPAAEPPLRVWESAPRAEDFVVDSDGRRFAFVLRGYRTRGEVSAGYLVLEDDLRVLLWRFAALGLVAFTLLWVPLEVAFRFTSSASLLSLDLCLLLFFALDALLRFRTAHIVRDESHQSAFAVSPALIAERYLEGYLALDLLTLVPYRLLFLAGGASRPTAELWSLVHLLRVLRLAELPRLRAEAARRLGLSGGGHKARSHLHTLENLALKWLRVAAIVLAAGHVVACLAFAFTRDGWDRFAGRPPPAGLAAAVAEGSYAAGGASLWALAGLRTRGVGEAYLAALYWSFTVLTSVGYGDIVPLNDDERVLAVVLAVLGAVLLAYVIEAVQGLLPSGEASASERNLRAFLEDKGVAGALKAELEAQADFFQQHKSSLASAPGLLARLPPALRHEVLLSEAKTHRFLSRVAIFHRASNAFVADLCAALVPTALPAGALAFHPGRPPNAVYFLASGRVALLVHFEGERRPSRGLARAGGLFGHCRLVAGAAVAGETAFAVTPIRAFALPTAALAPGRAGGGTALHRLRLRLADAVVLAAEEEVKLMGGTAEREDRRRRRRYRVNSVGGEGDGEGEGYEDLKRAAKRLLEAALRTARTIADVEEAALGGTGAEAFEAASGQAGGAKGRTRLFGAGRHLQAIQGHQRRWQRRVEAEEEAGPIAAMHLHAAPINCLLLEKAKGMRDMAAAVP